MQVGHSPTEEVVLGGKGLKSGQMSNPSPILHIRTNHNINISMDVKQLEIIMT
jgi:hypothetical protein